MLADLDSMRKTLALGTMQLGCFGRKAERMNAAFESFIQAILDHGQNQVDLIEEQMHKIGEMISERE